MSNTESIEQTPPWMMVHSITWTIAEFYSRHLAAKVTKGLMQ